jgi:hypothetical protein
VANVTLVATTTEVTVPPVIDLTPVTLAIDALNDFDPLNDVVAHVSLVDVTTEVTIPAPVELSPVLEAIGLLNNFNPGTDVVANVALVDTTTTVTFPAPVDFTPVTDAIGLLHNFDPVNDVVANVALVDVTTALTLAPDVPTLEEIADAVWNEAVGDHAEVGSTGAALAAAGTATDPWATLLPGEYVEDSAGYLLAGMAERMEEQVEEGPVVVLPAPVPGQTVAYCMCYDEEGAIEAGVDINIQCMSASAAGPAAAYDGTIITLVSGNDGLATGPIPRGTHLAFDVWRGPRSRVRPPIRFTGVDADTLALPPHIGAP